MKKYKKLIWAFLSLLIAFLTIKAIDSQSKTLSFATLFKILKGASLSWMTLAFLTMAGFIIFEGIAIQSILKTIGSPRKFRQGMIYSTADIYFSAITPSASGGQPASAFFMMQDGISAGSTTAALIMNLVMYTVTLFLFGVLGLIAGFPLFCDMSLISKVLILIGFTILLFLTFFFLLLLRRGKKLFACFLNLLVFLHKIHLVHRLDKRKRKLARMRRDYEECTRAMNGKWKGLLKLLMWNMLQRFSQIMVTFCVYMAVFGEKAVAVNLIPLQILVAVGANSIPIPGAMGVSDYLMLNGFSQIMYKEEAFHLELISRGISFYICVLISMLLTLTAYICLQIRKRNQINRKKNQENIQTNNQINTKNND